MSNPIIQWLAAFLGWDPGIVVMLTTVVVLVVGVVFVAFCIDVLPRILEREYRTARGPRRWLLGLLLAVAIVLAFVLNIFVVIAVAISALWLAGEARDWWHKGK